MFAELCMRQAGCSSCACRPCQCHTDHGFMHLHNNSPQEPSAMASARLNITCCQHLVLLYCNTSACTGGLNKGFRFGFI